MICSSFIALLIVVTTAQVQQIQEFPTIIIGAGMAGLGASQKLTQANEPHLMIEAGASIGGRIAAGTFNGATVDIGATFLHYPYDHGPLHNYRNQMGIGTIDANFANEVVYYEGNVSTAAQTDLDSAEAVYTLVQ